jgi:hypothetical protein
MNDVALKTTAPDNTSDKKDAAWAAINTPMHPDALLTFVLDVERLLRINPMLEFKKWEKNGASEFRMKVRNISQETPFELETPLRVHQIPGGVEIVYDEGIKSRTTLEIEATKLENGEPGSKLTITDFYDRLDEEQRKDHLNEVDKSLVIWATDIQRYLLMWQRWSRFKFWRWYMRRVWQPMKPSGRRITYMLLWISVVEIALIMLGVGIYFAEYR